MCKCSDLDQRVIDGPGKPGAFSDETLWAQWYASELDRIVAIGRARLLVWWETTKSISHPEWYGDTNHNLASAVAYNLAHDGPISPTMRQREQCDDPALSWPQAVTNAAIRRLQA